MLIVYSKPITFHVGGQGYRHGPIRVSVFVLVLSWLNRLTKCYNTYPVRIHLSFCYDTRQRIGQQPAIHIKGVDA